VVGIVETGVDLIAQQFDKTPDATAIIFATRTTIGSETHKNLLIDRGYPADQIVGQACHRLPGAIERGYDSEETVGFIQGFVQQALKQVTNNDNPIFASLNCTHFGYSINQFKQIFAEAGYPDIEIIDPNPKMGDFLFREKFLNRYGRTNVTVDVMSKVKVRERKRKSLGSLLGLTSSLTAEALNNYTFDDNLFDSKFDSTTIDR